MVINKFYYLFGHVLRHRRSEVRMSHGRTSRDRRVLLSLGFTHWVIISYFGISNDEIPCSN